MERVAPPLACIRHVPDNITEQTLDLGVRTVYSCEYRAS